MRLSIINITIVKKFVLIKATKKQYEILSPQKYYVYFVKVLADTNFFNTK